MKVWQAGSHLTMQRGAEVNDWSWAQTARRVSTLARLTAPPGRSDASRDRLARRQTKRSRLSLAKLAIDDGISGGDLEALTLFGILFVVAGLANLLASMAQTYFTAGPGAHPRRPAQQALPPPAAALPRLLRAQPCRGGRQPPDNDVEALDQLVTDGVSASSRTRFCLHGGHPLRAGLAARLRRSLLPAKKKSTSVFRRRSSRASGRAERLTRHGDARRGHRRHVVQSFTRNRRTRAQTRIGEQPLPRLEPGDRRPERALLSRSSTSWRRWRRRPCSASAAGSRSRAR